MTTATEILMDAFGRVHDLLPQLLGDLDARALLWRPDADANSMGWLAWHLLRVQDDHMAGVGEIEQVYTRDGFAAMFDLPWDDSAIGYGQTSEEVGRFSVEGPDLLIDYANAVHAQTEAVLGALSNEDYARIVDRNWNPPVTAAARIVSVVGDITQHAGQIGYVKGLYARSH